VPDSEELVGVTHRRWWGWFYWMAILEVEVASDSFADIIEE